MAMGFFQHLAGEAAIAWSGGSEPGHEVNPSAIAAMREVGIDISAEFPKPWTDEIVRAAATAFGEVGYRTATLEAIAERAGVSKVTLYRYVSSKEELLYEICATSFHSK